MPTWRRPAAVDRGGLDVWSCSCGKPLADLPLEQVLMAISGGVGGSVAAWASSAAVVGVTSSCTGRWTRAAARCGGAGGARRVAEAVSASNTWSSPWATTSAGGGWPPTSRRIAGSPTRPWSATGTSSSTAISAGAALRRARRHHVRIVTLASPAWRCGADAAGPVPIALLLLSAADLAHPISDPATLDKAVRRRAAGWACGPPTVRQPGRCLPHPGRRAPGCSRTPAGRPPGGGDHEGHRG